MAVQLAYPQELTDKWWQKKKGVIGKTKKTGVGESLIALEKAFKQTHFAGVDGAKMIGDLTDPPVFERNSAKLLAVLDQQAKKLEPLLSTVDKKITDAKTTFAKDKQVSASLDEMAREVTALRNEMKKGGRFSGQVSAELKSALASNIARSMPCQAVLMGGGAAQGLIKARDDAARELAGLRATPTINAMVAMWTPNTSGGRRVTTAIRAWDGAAGYTTVKAGVPKELAKSIYGRSANETFGQLPWINQGGDVNRLRADLQTEVNGGRDEAEVIESVSQVYLDSLKKMNPLVQALARLEEALTKASK